ncbi:unnamed protein product, partial [Polarella glacialis]
PIPRHEKIDATQPYPGPLAEVSAYPGEAAEVPQEALRYWTIYTDGSRGNGTETEAGEVPLDQAGWGVAIFHDPQQLDRPTRKLYGPVIVTPWDTGAAQRPAIPSVMRNDSEYAAQMAQRMWTPQHENVELINKVADLVDQVQRQRRLGFLCVKGHSGEPGNEWADKLAERVATGAVSPQSKRCAKPVNIQENNQEIQSPNGASKRSMYKMSTTHHDTHNEESPDGMSGTRDANQTCRQWRKEFGSISARYQHEKKYTGKKRKGKEDSSRSWEGNSPGGHKNLAEVFGPSPLTRAERGAGYKRSETARRG